MLSRMLDAAHLRQRVIAANVANVNTPGYRQMDVTFEDELARRVKDGESPRGVTPRVVEGRGGKERADGNNVDIDAELGRLNKNSLLSNAWTQILASRLAAMRSAITGR